MLVRQATLDDTQQDCGAFQRRVPFGSGWNEQGQVEDLPYDALTIYERWLHGGAWMSLETGAIWLSHVLSGNGLAYVMEDGGRDAGLCRSLSQSRIDADGRASAFG